MAGARSYKRYLSQWVSQLSTAPGALLLALVAALAEEVRGQPQADAMNRDVSLFWQSALRATSTDAAVPLGDIVRNSQSTARYLPSLVQEVLLNAFGGQQ